MKKIIIIACFFLAGFISISFINVIFSKPTPIQAFSDAPCTATVIQGNIYQNGKRPRGNYKIEITSNSISGYDILENEYHYEIRWRRENIIAPEEEISNDIHIKVTDTSTDEEIMIAEMGWEFANPPIWFKTSNHNQQGYELPEEYFNKQYKCSDFKSSGYHQFNLDLKIPDTAPETPAASGDSTSCTINKFKATVEQNGSSVPSGNLTLSYHSKDPIINTSYDYVISNGTISDGNVAPPIVFSTDLNYYYTISIDINGESQFLRSNFSILGGNYEQFIQQGDLTLYFFNQTVTNNFCTLPVYNTDKHLWDFNKIELASLTPKFILEQSDGTPAADISIQILELKGSSLKQIAIGKTASDGTVTIPLFDMPLTLFFSFLNDDEAYPLKTNADNSEYLNDRFHPESSFPNIQTSDFKSLLNQPNNEIKLQLDSESPLQDINIKGVISYYSEGNKSRSINALANAKELSDADEDKILVVDSNQEIITSAANSHISPPSSPTAYHYFLIDADDLIKENNSYALYVQKSKGVCYKKSGYRFNNGKFREGGSDDRFISFSGTSLLNNSTDDDLIIFIQKNVTFDCSYLTKAPTKPGTGVGPDDTPGTHTAYEQFATSEPDYNPFGMHLLIEPPYVSERIASEIETACPYVGDWGFVKYLWYYPDGSTTAEAYDGPAKTFITQAIGHDMIPVLRLATHHGGEWWGGYWLNPVAAESDPYPYSPTEVADRIMAMKTARDTAKPEVPLIVEIFNEPNLKHQWGGQDNSAEEYANYLIELRTALDAKGLTRPTAEASGDNVWIASAGLSPCQESAGNEMCQHTDDVTNPAAYLEKMVAIDGFVDSFDILGSQGQFVGGTTLTECSAAPGDGQTYNPCYYAAELAALNGADKPVFLFEAGPRDSATRAADVTSLTTLWDNDERIMGFTLWELQDLDWDNQRFPDWKYIGSAQESAVQSAIATGLEKNTSVDRRNSYCGGGTADNSGSTGGTDKQGEPAKNPNGAANNLGAAGLEDNPLLGMLAGNGGLTSITVESKVAGTIGLWRGVCESCQQSGLATITFTSPGSKTLYTPNTILLNIGISTSDNKYYFSPFSEVTKAEDRNYTITFTDFDNAKDQTGKNLILKECDCSAALLSPDSSSEKSLAEILFPAAHAQTLAASGNTLALVTITNGTNEYNIISDSDGSFSLRAEPGTYDITISSSGYKTLHDSWTADDDQYYIGRFELEAGDPNEKGGTWEILPGYPYSSWGITSDGEIFFQPTENKYVVYEFSQGDSTFETMDFDYNYVTQNGSGADIDFKVLISNGSETKTLYDAGTISDGTAWKAADQTSGSSEVGFDENGEIDLSSYFGQDISIRFVTSYAAGSTPDTSGPLANAMHIRRLVLHSSGIHTAIGYDLQGEGAQIINMWNPNYISSYVSNDPYLPDSNAITQLLHWIHPEITFAAPDGSTYSGEIQPFDSIELCSEERSNVIAMTPISDSEPTTMDFDYTADAGSALDAISFSAGGDCSNPSDATKLSLKAIVLDEDGAINEDESRTLWESSDLGTWTSQDISLGSLKGKKLILRLQAEVNDAAAGNIFPGYFANIRLDHGNATTLAATAIPIATILAFVIPFLVIALGIGAVIGIGYMKKSK